MVLESIRVLTWVVSACSCGASELTCTVLVTAPTFILKVETRDLVEHQGDGRLDSRVKTRCLCLYFVGANGKIGKGKYATLRGFGGGGRTTLGVAAP